MNKRIFLIIALMGIIAISFISVIPSYAVNPSVVQTKFQQCNAFTCSVNPTTPLTVGNSIYVGIAFTGDSSHAITAYSCSDSLGNSYTNINRTVDQANSLIVAYCTTSVTFGGSDSISISVTNPSGSTHTLLENVWEVANGVYHSFNQQEGGGNTYTVTCNANDLCLSGVAANTGGGIWTYSGTFDTSVCSCSTAQGLGHTSSISTTWSGVTGVAFSEFAFIDITSGGAGGCAIYACQTSTYSVTWTNATCVSGSSGTCTMTTTFTIVSYDSTSTNITIIYCDSQNGCAHYTQNTTKVVTYTDTSVSLVTSTVTTTQTVYQINAPNPLQFTFWLFPLLFMGLGLAIVFGAFNATKSKSGVATNQIGLPDNERVLVTMILLGLIIGTLLGTAAGLVNWVFPVVFIVFMIIYGVLTR